MATVPAVGKIAPAFSGIAIGGDIAEPREIRLSDFKGEALVLYFYPKDDTPGCTRQACGLRDRWNEIASKARVLGVSVDSIATHRKFIGKHRLPFPLLSDEDHTVAEKFGVWVEKSLYGRRYMGTERSTFIVGPDQRIRSILARVKPDLHAGQVLSVLESGIDGARPGRSRDRKDT